MDWVGWENEGFESSTSSTSSSLRTSTQHLHHQISNEMILSITSNRRKTSINPSDASFAFRWSKSELLLLLERSRLIGFFMSNWTYRTTVIHCCWTMDCCRRSTMMMILIDIDSSEIVRRIACFGIIRTFTSIYKRRKFKKSRRFLLLFRCFASDFDRCCCKRRFSSNNSLFRCLRFLQNQSGIPSQTFSTYFKSSRSALNSW